MPSKDAVELASDSRMQSSENVGCSKDSKLPKAKPIELGTSAELELFKPWSLVGGFGLGVSSEVLIAQDRCAKAPNEPSSETAEAGAMAARAKAAEQPA